MHINIVVPGGDELDQLLYKLADQIVEIQRTVSEIKATAGSIQMNLNLSPGAPETVVPASGEDIGQVAETLVERLRDAAQGNGGEDAP